MPSRCPECKGTGIDQGVFGRRAPFPNVPCPRCMPDDRPVSPEERWTIIRRRDWPNDRGTLLAPGAPVPEPDDLLEVIEVVPALSTPAGPSPEATDGSESTLAKVTLAQFMATGDGAFLDNAQADTLREMIRVLIEAAAVARARRAVALSAARPSSPTPEETPKCPRLLVGMGDDTYDPECCLPLGHSGRCRAEPEGTHA